MRLIHRFSLAIIGALFLSMGLFLPGCQLFQKEPTPSEAISPERSIDIVDSTQLALTQLLNGDSLQLASPTALDSQLVAVPAKLLDSLLRELAVLKTAVNIPGDSAGNDAVNTAINTTANSDTSNIVEDPDLQGQLTDAVGGIQHWGRNILLSIFTILVFFYLIRSFAWTLERFSEQSATRRLFFKRLIPIVRVLIWSLAIYIILIHIFGLKESQLISAWAAIGLAVGFASQDILKNIFGGIIIIIDQPFQVGDKINIGGTYGEVTSIGLRSTRIVTPDDNLVSVPNAQVVESQVANANAGALDCQVVIDLYLPGWVDVLEAKAIAYDAAANSNYVYLEKPIVVNIKDLFKETFLTHLAVKAYVIDTRYEFAFASDVTESAKVEFQRRGMLVPLANVLAMGQNDSGNGSVDSHIEES